MVAGNWAVLAKKNVWATYSAKAREKVKLGDKIAFYVKGTGNFRAIYRLSGEWYTAPEPIWYDELAAGKIIYKHQVQVELLELGVANYKSLVQTLTFVKDKSQLGIYIQAMGGGPANHGKPVSDADMAIIGEELRRNPSTLEESPPVEETASPADHIVAGTSAQITPQAVLLPWVFQDLEAVGRGVVNPEKYVGNRDPSTVFEDLVFLAFRFLGYNTSRQLGYKRGPGRPGPDGEARSSITDYVIVYDAKQRADAYTLSAADHRALRDYVEEVQSRGDRNVVCMVVGSQFSGEPRALNGVQLVFLPVRSLLELVALKIMNPDIVNGRSLRKLFGPTRLITTKTIDEWAAEHDADRIDLSRLLKVVAKRTTT